MSQTERPNAPTQTQPAQPNFHLPPFFTVTLPLLAVVLTVVVGLGSWAVVSINSNISNVNANLNSTRTEVNSGLARLTDRVFNVERQVTAIAESGTSPGVLSISNQGGNFDVTFDPREIGLVVPVGAFNVRTLLTKEPNCASTANLGSPAGYRPSDWSYGFIAFTSFAKPIDISFRLSPRDFQLTGATKIEDLAAFRWVPGKGDWDSIPVTFDRQRQTLVSRVTDPGCFLVAAKGP